MFRVTPIARKVSSVAIRPVITSLEYQRRYGIRKKMELGQKYNAVTEENRYESLRLLLTRLSSYVGRRQYKLQSDLCAKYLSRLQRHGVDWHDMKLMTRPQLLDLFREVGVSHTDRTLLVTALSARVCGVLTRGEQLRDPGLLCMRRGREEHGWRCGVAGHRAGVYFERKPAKAGDSSLLHVRSAVVDKLDSNGVVCEVRPQPDFSVVGRLTHDVQPRVWSTPQSPLFDVLCIGYEFRVHPNDPRAKSQIVDAEKEWLMHADVIKSVIWEMLELYAVERKPQRLELVPGEMGDPDSPEHYSSCFSTRLNVPKKNLSQDEAAQVGKDGGDEGKIAEEEVVVEQRMMSSSSSSSTAEGDHQHQPWFLPPLDQEFVDGIPANLPFAPSIIIRSSFRQVQRDSNFAQSLVTPVCDVRCYIHPEAGFWWQRGGPDESKALENIVNWAKRIPYALPFSLYFRVDAAKNIRADAEFMAKRQALMEARQQYFDLSRFVEFWTRKGTVSAESVDDDRTTDAAGEQTFSVDSVDTRGSHRGEGEEESDDVNPPGWR